MLWETGGVRLGAPSGTSGEPGGRVLWAGQPLEVGTPARDLDSGPIECETYVAPDSARRGPLTACAVLTVPVPGVARAVAGRGALGLSPSGFRFLPWGLGSLCISSIVLVSACFIVSQCGVERLTHITSTPTRQLNTLDENPVRTTQGWRLAPTGGGK